MLTRKPEELKRGDVLTTRDLRGRRVVGIEVLSVQRIRGGVRVDVVGDEVPLVLDPSIMVEVDR